MLNLSSSVIQQNNQLDKYPEALVISICLVLLSRRAVQQTKGGATGNLISENVNQKK